MEDNKIELGKKELRLEFLGQWRSGDGSGGNHETNSYTEKDTNQLPKLNGSLVKGQIKAAMYEFEEMGWFKGLLPKTDGPAKKLTELLFGSVANERSSHESISGMLVIGGAATLGAAEQQKFEQAPEYIEHIYHKRSSQASNAQGATEKGTLRTKESSKPAILRTVIEVQFETLNENLAKQQKEFLASLDNRGLCLWQLLSTVLLMKAMIKRPMSILIIAPFLAK